MAVVIAKSAGASVPPAGEREQTKPVTGRDPTQAFRLQLQGKLAPEQASAFKSGKEEQSASRLNSRLKRNPGSATEVAAQDGGSGPLQQPATSLSTMQPIAVAPERETTDQAQEEPPFAAASGHTDVTHKKPPASVRLSGKPAEEQHLSAGAKAGEQVAASQPLALAPGKTAPDSPPPTSPPSALIHVLQAQPIADTVLQVGPLHTKTHAHTARPAPVAEQHSPEEVATLSASPDHLEVGLSAGTHGWLRVRAAVDSEGAVSAQVIAASPAAAESMHKQLPSLSAYLEHEHVALSSLVVQAAQPAASSQGATAGQHGEQSPEAFTTAGRGTRDEQGQGRLPFPVELDAPFTGGLAMAILPGTEITLPGLLSSSGGWLSVRV